MGEEVVLILSSSWSSSSSSSSSLAKMLSRLLELSLPLLLLSSGTGGVGEKIKGVGCVVGVVIVGVVEWLSFPTNVVSFVVGVGVGSTKTDCEDNVTLSRGLMGGNRFVTCKGPTPAMVEIVTAAVRTTIATNMVPKTIFSNIIMAVEFC